MPAAHEPTDAPTPPPAPCFWHRDRRAVADCHGCGRRVCHDCGAEASADDPPQPVAACPTCAPLFGLPSSVPFEDPGGLGGFFRTWGRALATPGALFAAFPRRGAARATVFAYCTWLPATIVVSTCVGLLILALSGIGHSGSSDAGVAMVVSVSVVWGVFALTPLVVLAVAAPLHVVVLLGRGEAGFTATYRILCYLAAMVATAAPVVLIGGGVLGAVVPFGALLVLAGAEGWHAWALYHAVRRVHGLRPGAAVVAALVPFAIRCVFVGGFMALTMVAWLL